MFVLVRLIATIYDMSISYFYDIAILFFKRGLNQQNIELKFSNFN